MNFEIRPRDAHCTFPITNEILFSDHSTTTTKIKGRRDIEREKTKTKLESHKKGEKTQYENQRVKAREKTVTLSEDLHQTG